MPTDRPQPRPRRQECDRPKVHAPDIAGLSSMLRIVEAYHKCRAPPGLAGPICCRRRHNLAQTHSIQADPAKMSRTMRGLSFHHFEARTPPPSLRLDIAVAERSGPSVATTEPDCAA